jgi:hypothetical protein
LGEAERNRSCEVERRRNERRVVGVKGESVRSLSADENAIDEKFIGLLMTLESGFEIFRDFGVREREAILLNP